MGLFRSRSSDTGSFVVVRSNFYRGGEDVLMSELWDSEGDGMEIEGSEGVYIGSGWGREEDIFLDLEDKRPS